MGKALDIDILLKYLGGDEYEISIKWEMEECKMTYTFDTEKQAHDFVKASGIKIQNDGLEAYFDEILKDKSFEIEKSEKDV